MNKTRILILGVIVLLVILCLTLVGVYFFTDTFKSNQELFYKYASKMDVASFFDTEFYNEYSKKLSENNYEKNGNISIKGITSGTEQEYANITYATKNDKVNKLSSTNVSINASGQEMISFNILRNEDLYGLIINNVLNKYIAIDNNNLKAFAEKMGMPDTNSIPDKFDIDSYMSKLIVSDQEKETLKNLGTKFIEVANTKISKDKFLKTGKVTINVDGKDINANGYKVSITQGEMYNIVIDFLKVLQNDEAIYKMIASRGEGILPLTFEDYKNQIGQVISGMEGNRASIDESKELCTITVYESKGKFAKLDIEIKGENENNQTKISIENNENKMIATIYQKKEDIDDSFGPNPAVIPVPTETTVKIVKTLTDNETRWEAAVETIKKGQTGTPSNISIVRTGDTDITHEIEIRYGDQIIISLNENTKFVDTLEIERFNEENHVILNNLSKEELTQLFNIIIDQISAKTGIDIRNISQGAFNNADVATEEIRKAEAEEQVQLDLAEAMAELYVAGNSYPSLDNISVEFEKIGYSVTKNSDGTITIKKSNTTATVNGNHEIEILTY